MRRSLLCFFFLGAAFIFLLVASFIFLANFLAFLLTALLLYLCIRFREDGFKVADSLFSFESIDIENRKDGPSPWSRSAFWH